MHKPTATKINILKHAQVLFAKRGYEGTSMSELALRVGIEKASLYYFFKDKESLWNEVITDVWGRLAADIASLSEVDRGKYETEQDFFAAILLKVITVHLEAGMSGTIEESCNNNKSVCRKIMEHANTMRRLLRKYLSSQGISNPANAEEVIVNAIHGYVVHALKKKPLVRKKEYASFLAQLFIHN